MRPTLFYSVTQMLVLFLELYGYEEPLIHMQNLMIGMGLGWFFS